MGNHVQSSNFSLPAETSEAMFLLRRSESATLNFRLPALAKKDKLKFEL
jgi:hypothetical protein